MKQEYGQFCPISKAMEALGERWSLLIVREVLLGSERFSDLQRGLPNISPTMLNRRLGELVDCGIIAKSRPLSGRGYRYQLTQSGRELEPVLVALGSWGMRWARGQMRDEELDVQMLMHEIQRECQPQQLPGQGRKIIHFHFTDLADFNHWWLKVDGQEVDLCIEPPGEDEHLLIETCVRALTEVWMGDADIQQAIRQRRIKVLGYVEFEKSISRWLGHHRLAGIRPANAY